MVKLLRRSSNELMAIAFDGGFLADVLAQETVSIFVDSAFPRCVRMGEVHFETKLLFELWEAGELFSVVDGHRFFEGIGDVFESRTSGA